MLKQSKSQIEKKHLEKALEKEGFKIIAGVDEAGRGPLAGPVVAGAVVLKEPILTVEIRDSKKLTVKARERAFKEILKRAYVGIGIINRKNIDAINIHQARLLAMRQAVLNLKIKPDCLLIDGPYRLDTGIKNISVVKGDEQCFSIACASIVAKVVRDSIMRKLDEIYPEYDFRNNKGYGTQKHLKTIKTLGSTPFHRLSFFPFKTK